MTRRCFSGALSFSRVLFKLTSPQFYFELCMGSTRSPCQCIVIGGCFLSPLTDRAGLLISTSMTKDCLHNFCKFGAAGLLSLLFSGLTWVNSDLPLRELSLIITNLIFQY